MKEKPLIVIKSDKASNAAPKSPYVRPEIVSYDKDEIIEIIGPALACASSDSCPVAP